ncbi:MAG TPA: Smr/MutS family protein [Devosia sp.]
MAKRDKPALPDWHIWAEVAQTVSPLQRTLMRERLKLAEEPLPLPKGPPAPRHKPIKVPAPMPSYQSSGKPGRQANQDIEPKLKRKLVRGHIEIDGTIDLHGMRQAEAHAALTRFVHSRAARGDRTLLVITGKGLKKVNGDATVIVERGVLRSMLPIWLSEPGLAPLIAGWDVAAQGHGGEGAYYVRLRRTERRT